ncbi:MAG: hypothetical protein QW360_03540, partial [Thermofilum sp.]
RLLSPFAAHPRRRRLQPSITRPPFFQLYTVDIASLAALLDHARNDQIPPSGAEDPIAVLSRPATRPPTPPSLA